MEAILLAAGLSKRMGRQKLLLPFGGSTVIETVIENLRGSGIEKIHAVLSREVAEALPALPRYVDVRINEAPERGQSSSLVIGLDMTKEGSDFCIMLADLPLVEPAAIAVLLRRFAQLSPEKTLLAPWRSGAFGHPMLYRALWRRRLLSAEGDSGAKKIVSRYASEIEQTEAPDCHFKDMDTPQDYEEHVRQVALRTNIT